VRILAATVSMVALLGACASRSTPAAKSPTPAASATAATTPTATPCAVAGASTQPAQSTAGPSKQALLRDVRFTASACPRVVFEFENAPLSYTVEYRNPPFSNCGSGARVDTSGWGSAAYVVFHSNSASGVDLSGPTFRRTYTKSNDIAPASSILRRIHETCDFEGTLEWVVALDVRHPFKVSTLTAPPRLVIDISAAPAA